MKTFEHNSLNKIRYGERDRTGGVCLGGLPVNGHKLPCNNRPTHWIVDPDSGWWFCEEHLQEGAEIYIKSYEEPR